MSVVACRITGAGYEIAADSITVRGYTQTKGQTTNFGKLFEVNGMAIGTVGYAEEGMMMRLFAGTRKPERPTEGAILEFLSEFSDWMAKKTNDGELNNSYILGVDGEVFTTEGFLVQKVTTYEAIGAGMQYALSALYLGHSAEKAVETAIELSIYCESPINTVIRSVRQ